jgi:hypothetical protein
MPTTKQLTPDQAQSLSVALLLQHPDIMWYDGYTNEVEYLHECLLGEALCQQHGLQPGIWCIFYGKLGEMPKFDFLRRRTDRYGYVLIGEHDAAA